MFIKDQSNEVVLKSGRKQLNLLEKNLYLHNFEGNYYEISDDFDPVDISLMDKIWIKIIKQQKQEEQKIYSLLKIKDVAELNEKYLEAGGRSNFLSTTATELISRASKEALEDLSGRVTKKKISSLSTAIGPVLEEMVDEAIGDDKELANALKKGLGEKTAKILLNLKGKENLPKNTKDYVKRMSKSISAQFRGDILETESGVVMARVIKQLAGKKGKVKYSGTVTNARGKYIKADQTVELKDEISFGISDKNYLADSEGNVEVSLHSSGTLENFYGLVKGMSINGKNLTNLAGIQRIVTKFRKT